MFTDRIQDRVNEFRDSHEDHTELRECAGILPDVHYKRILQFPALFYEGGVGQFGEAHVGGRSSVLKGCLMRAGEGCSLEAKLVRYGPIFVEVVHA